MLEKAAAALVLRGGQRVNNSLRTRNRETPPAGYTEKYKISFSMWTDDIDKCVVCHPSEMLWFANLAGVK